MLSGVTQLDPGTDPARQMHTHTHTCARTHTPPESNMASLCQRRRQEKFFWPLWLQPHYAARGASTAVSLPIMPLGIT